MRVAETSSFLHHIPANVSWDAFGCSALSIAASFVRLLCIHNAQTRQKSATFLVYFHTQDISCQQIHDSSFLGASYWEPIDRQETHDAVAALVRSSAEVLFYIPSFTLNSRSGSSLCVAFACDIITAVSFKSISPHAVTLLLIHTRSQRLWC